MTKNNNNNGCRISLSTKIRIQHLLATTRMTCIAIATATGVSKKTVYRLAKKMEVARPKYTRREYVPSLTASGTPKKCPGCGAMVYLPCIKCEADQYKERARNRKRKGN